jgi:hypothetical protein
MPRLFIIVANARWECLRLGNLLLRRAVLEVSRRLILGRGHSPTPRRRGLGSSRSILLDKVELLAQTTS